MSDIQYDELIEALAGRFPEVDEALRLELARWDDEEPPTYGIYSEVFVPALVSALASHDPADVDLARRGVNFIEELLGSSDPEVQTFAVLGVLNEVIDDPEALRGVRELMGPRIVMVMPVDRSSGRPMAWKPEEQPE